MDAILIETEKRLLDRAFLYEDPESFRSGVREAVRAMSVPHADAEPGGARAPRRRILDSEAAVDAEPVHDLRIAR